MRAALGWRAATNPVVLRYRYSICRTGRPSYRAQVLLLRSSNGPAVFCDGKRKPLREIVQSRKPLGRSTDTSLSPPPYRHRERRRVRRHGSRLCPSIFHSIGQGVSDEFPNATSRRCRSALPKPHRGERARQSLPRHAGSTPTPGHLPPSQPIRDCRDYSSRLANL